MNHSTPPASFVRSLGLLDSAMLVAGSMIGSGIFIVSADIARQLGSAGWLLLVWALTGGLTLIAALSYGELAAAMPKAGGMYVYLREAFGPLSGFLYGWTLFTVIQTGTIAAVAVAFAKFLGEIVPAVSAQNWIVKAGPVGLNTQMAVAIALLVLLTWVNTQGVKTGARVQNVFTIAKIGSLAALIVLGVALGRRQEAISANFGDFWRGADWGWAAVKMVGLAMVGSLFSSDAWHTVTFTAGEVRNPKRDLPLSLALGVGLVSTIYLLCNLVYLMALPLSGIQNAPEDRVATSVMAVMSGESATWIMAVAVLVSTFGCVNGLVMTGARVYYAMAKDGLFFKGCGEVDAKTHVPVRSLWVQCAWGCALTLSGTYSDLLDYVIFAVLLFYILTIAGLFVLRRTRPAMERPYRAIGYPVLPAIYIVAATVVEVLLLIYKPSYTWPGLIIVMLGVPVYACWAAFNKRRSLDEPVRN